ncbi:MAG: NAD-dependent epimerase/dehydratase family protein [Bacteroidales bacterium]|nr:NAD-dependent epimerase/dehydratase family protein [Bacteroidales bacterium]
MIKVGITGQAGFVGTHLFNFLSLDSVQFKLIPFEDVFFEDPEVLKDWVSKCDAIVHLAALNRHNDPDVIFQTNLELVKQLVTALEETQSTPHLLFSSSTQEEYDNSYGRSKKEGRELLINWADRSGALFTGLVIPNVFGPFGNPYYNSVVATFSHQITHGEQTRLDVDNLMKLVYVGELVEAIRDCIANGINDHKFSIPHTSELKVTELLNLLENYQVNYAENGMIPSLNNVFERNLFNTFRSYMDIPKHYPVYLREHRDDRGSFVETMHLGQGGQVSFSTTKPGITRGNHYHTRKIERFVVIQGKALIQIRRIGTEEVIEYKLDGKNPSYVDMPVWYTHNITNIGGNDLFTLFWINEFYDPEDPDTFYEVV